MGFTYHPQKIFTGNYATVLLNRKINFKNDFFLKIWNNATVRHVVDGGSNHFFEFLDQLPSNLKGSLKFPDIASGDFDSISDESMNRLKIEKNCKIVLTEDQDETDFTKALAVLHDHRINDGKLSKVIVLCENDGRLDQIIANMNTLHKNAFLKDISGEMTPVYLLSSSCLSWLIPSNLQATVEFQDEEPNLMCGVLNFMGPTTFTSKGLKWDLSPDLVCSFGGMVSTSNKVVKKTLEITSIDKHSVFTVELNEEQFILPS